MTGVVLTSGAAVQAGKRTAINTFSHDDYVVQYTDFAWNDPTTAGGVHRVKFEWFNENKLVSQTPTRYLRFETSPYTLWTRRAASTIGIGHCMVKTTVDDQVVSTSAFDITS